MTEKLPTSRRTFLADLSTGISGIALGSLLASDGLSSDIVLPNPHIVPRARNVIWLFMIGGTSHLESFDPKPALDQYAGKLIGDTPYKDVIRSPFLENERDFFDDLERKRRTIIFPMQVGFRKRGESGLDVSDWWPHVGDCADDLSVIRSVWTEDNNHGAQLQFHTGRHRNDGFIRLD